MESLHIEEFKREAHAPLVEPLTRILHESYAPLAAKGLRYMATHQSAEVTMSRLTSGNSFLLYWQGDLIGTITLRMQKPDSRCEWYRKEGVAHFSQFAVHPRLQGLGIGSRVMGWIEQKARELGARELALDTSEHADHLIAMYERRGYRFVQHTRWEEVNYRSVVMSKRLTDEASLLR